MYSYHQVMYYLIECLTLRSFYLGVRQGFGSESYRLINPHLISTQICNLPFTLCRSTHRSHPCNWHTHPVGLLTPWAEDFGKTERSTRIYQSNRFWQIQQGTSGNKAKSEYSLVQQWIWCLRIKRIYIYIYIYIYIRWSLNTFPDFFRMSTFIDSTHIKL